MHAQVARVPEPDVVTIVSFWGPSLGTEPRSYKPGGYEMPFRSDLSVPFATLRVEARDERYLQVAYPDPRQNIYKESHHDAREIAESLVESHPNVGLFIIEGDRDPNAEELKEGTRKMRSLCRRLLNDGDREWLRYHDPTKLTGAHRFAAVYLNERREWAAEPTDRKPCAACGETIWADAVKCPKCQAILDPEKAAKFFPSEKAKK